MSTRTPEENREYMRQYRKKNREKVLEQQRTYQADYHERKKIEAERKDKELKKAEHMAKLLLQRLSDSEQQQVNALLDSGKPEEARRLVGFLYSQQREKKQFDIQVLKHELLEKYVHSDPEYKNLTQEGQVYYEHSFLAYLDFLEKINNIGHLRIMEDRDVLKKINIFHLDKAQEIVSELQKVLDKSNKSKNSEKQL
jgi:hypothetical protein